MLVHTRLAVIDLAGGQQPIANEHTSVHVVFNGEIYNHVERRAEWRARGIVFGHAVMPKFWCTSTRNVAWKCSPT